MSSIILTTLNARYIHLSLGLRYLMANMNELEGETEIVEFIIKTMPIDIAEQLLIDQPKIIGFGLYLWNIEQTAHVIAIIKQVRPDVIIVLGGPEISYETESQPIATLADYIIKGQADIEFGCLCKSLLDGKSPKNRLIAARPVSLTSLQLPYGYYTDEDISKRIIYVEASRGCPFNCEFCLSSLDEKVEPFDLDLFLKAMETLYSRGARRFKFVDRTFNLNIDRCLRIIDFFLERIDSSLFLHFEIVPDYLPEELKKRIMKFPKGSLQLEVGVQSFDPGALKHISRKQDKDKTINNLTWLRNETNAHLHADLIIGLPGEDMGTFAKGFNQLVALDPHEIQVGILKRLRGVPIDRHTDNFAMRYNPHPPYNILSTGLIDFQTIQRLSRFARYWELIANSGHFIHTRPLLLGNDPFGRFLCFSDWLFKETGQTHNFALARLFELLHEGLTQHLGIKKEDTINALWQDYKSTGLKARPKFLGSK